MKKILLPKKYLSYSQINLWKWSPLKYKKIYFEGEEYPTNQAMDFGKNFAEIMEGKKKTDDIIVQGVMCQIPKYDTAEKEIKTKIEDINLLGYLDSYCSKTHNFYEYKTGKMDWTQNKVDKADQITFYAMLIYLKYKVIPENIGLIWAETEIEDNMVRFTGNVKRFETNRALVDVLKMMAEIKKIAKKISVEYKEYLKIN